jgi:hypothetical protein
LSITQKKEMKKTLLQEVKAMNKIAGTQMTKQQEIALIRERLEQLNELEFGTQKAFDSYQKNHSLRDTTKVTVAGKKMSVSQAKDQSKDPAVKKGSAVFGKGKGKEVFGKGKGGEVFGKDKTSTTSKLKRNPDGFDFEASGKEGAISKYTWLGHQRQNGEDADKAMKSAKISPENQKNIANAWTHHSNNMTKTRQASGSGAKYDAEPFYKLVQSFTDKTQFSKIKPSLDKLVKKQKSFSGLK